MARDAFPHDPQDSREPSSGRDRPVGEGLQAAPVRDAEARAKDQGSSDRKPWPPEREEAPRAYALRDRTFLLRESELHALGELGRFRVVAASDLARHAYSGDRRRMERDFRRLERQSLVSTRTLEISGKKTLRVLSLTKTGSLVLKQSGRLPEDQRVYHGFVKPREAKHDADLYRLYQRAAERIVSEGGKPLRLVLDFELKCNLNRDRLLVGSEGNSPEALEHLAERHGLSVVDGKIPLPDLRVEYQTAEGEVCRMDLELATRHYRPKGLAEKARAGFAIYAVAEDAPRLRRILDERELTAGIFAL